MVPLLLRWRVLPKLKRCRHFSNSNYINNSYLNYVKINTNQKKNSNVEGQKETEREGDKGGKREKEREEEGEKERRYIIKKDIDISEDGYKKHNHHLKNITRLNTIKNNKPKTLANKLENDNTNNHSFETSDTLSTNKISGDSFFKTKNIKQKENMQIEKNSAGKLIYKQSNNDENANDFSSKEKVHKIDSRKERDRYKPPFQEDFSRNKRKDGMSTYKKNEDVYIENSENNIGNTEYADFMEDDKLKYYQNGRKENEKSNDLNFDIEDSETIKENTEKVHNKIDSMTNDLSGETFSKNRKANDETNTNKKNATGDSIDTSEGDNNNNKEDQDKMWEENEEDLPNIFEVDENLTEEEKKEKLKLIKLITEKLAGPLKSHKCENSTTESPKDSNAEETSTTNEDSLFADNRPIAIEVDGPSHFYANSNRYTTYTKLKHRILTKLGYNVIHISYIDWRKLRNKSEREEFILKKLKEKNDEFLDDNDRIYYNERMNMIKEDYMKYMKQKNEKNE